MQLGKKRRIIEAPDVELKTFQRILLDTVLYLATPTPWAHGFVPGRSVQTNAAPHCKQPWILNMDIKDFFPSIKFSRVLRVMRALPTPWRITEEEAYLLTKVVMRKGRLPQGAPTSPHLANLVSRTLDWRLAALSRQMGWMYTRYADDMTFSGSRKPKGLIPYVREIVHEEGFQVSDKKTKMLPNYRRQLVTGLVVNEHAAWPRELRRKLRAIKHQQKLARQAKSS